MAERPKILWVEEEPNHVRHAINYLDSAGYNVKLVASPQECIDLINEESFDLYIFDVCMKHGSELDSSYTRNGQDTGMILAEMVRKKKDLPLILGCTACPTSASRQWFTTFGHGLIVKSRLEDPDYLRKCVASLLQDSKLPPTVFIVHGHTSLVKTLSRFIRYNLGFPTPVILRETGGLGYTTIERFEELTENVDIVFVLLTPDDIAASAQDTNEQKYRARQNVILELGYFMGKLGRKRSSIILLRKGDLELPSDLSGVAIIDITNGIQAAEEKIRRELTGYLSEAVH